MATGGMEFQLPVQTNNPDFPFYHDDPLIHDGTLLFNEPANPLGKLLSVPPSAAGATAILRNHAWQEAVKLIGSGDEASLASTFRIASANDPAAFKADLSAKGGINGMLSQTSHNAANQGARIDVSTLIRDYMFANMGHKFGFARASFLRRNGTSSTIELNKALAYNNAATGSDQSFFAFTSKRTLPTSAPKLLGAQIAPGFEQLGHLFQAVAVEGFSGTVPASAAALAIYASLWGTPIGLASSSTFWNIGPSDVFYWFVIEDLTAGGLTYQEFLAGAYERWQEDTAPGGFYDGDTFSTLIA